ncbi:MAG: glycosyltransferase family 2 protein, partial [Candidatus Brocadiae bacterium]|nr:glycosyltransferase family 2 protein [Candidatus Brocadiia bacterium]
MMPSAPKVTVLTPTYNRPAYLADAIRSVVGQQFADWEMLVVNDGGTDVRGIVEGFGDPRISYFNRPENRGKAACLNFGLERARGQYVAYLDDDDIWYPNHLATLAGALDDNPQMGVAYSDLYAVAFLKGEDGRRYPLEKRVVICRDYNRMLMFHFNHTLHVSLMHHRELAVRAGGYDESIRVMIDWDLTRKLSFYTAFLHVRQTTGEYYQPVTGSDRISDLGRRDEEAYKRNLRRIRADLPPAPWPFVDKVAVVFPVSRWDDTAYDVIGYLLNKLDYPCRVVLVNRDPRRTREDCRRALGTLAELKNLHVESAGADGPLHEAYVAGARSVEADFYYLPSRRACLETGLRLITGLCYMAETGCDAVR